LIDTYFIALSSRIPRGEICVEARCSSMSNKVAHSESDGPSIYVLGTINWSPTFGWEKEILGVHL